jgi:hypothetical protein
MAKPRLSDEEILRKMDRLLRKYRPAGTLREPVPSDIPILTEIELDLTEAVTQDTPPPATPKSGSAAKQKLTGGQERALRGRMEQVFERVLRDLDEHIEAHIRRQLHEQLAATLEHAIGQASVGLKSQLLERIADTIAHAIADLIPETAEATPKTGRKSGTADNPL